MTKVTILGQSEPVKQEVNPIEFKHYLKTADLDNLVDLRFEENTSKPKHWDNITLLYKNYFKGLDLFFCSNNNEEVRAIILGHFNDGVVE